MSNLGCPLGTLGKRELQDIFLIVDCLRRILATVGGYHLWEAGPGNVRKVANLNPGNRLVSACVLALTSLHDGL